MLWMNITGDDIFGEFLIEALLRLVAQNRISQDLLEIEPYF